MTDREKTLNAIKRKSGTYVPFEFDLCPSLNERFKKETGARNYAEYFEFSYRKAYIIPVKPGEINLKYFPQGLKAAACADEFGVVFEPGGAEHFTHMRSPMKNFTDIKEYREYAFPEPDSAYDWKRFETDVAALKAADKVCMGCLAMTIFEQSWYLRGMEEFLMDMYTDEKTLKYLLDRITGIRCSTAAKIAEAGADVLHIGDDIATQAAMMMSVEMYRKWIKPRHREVIAAARAVNKDILIDYHSDGNCFDAIEDLIEIGVDILNPVQPECMDPVKVKELFGDRLSFRGTIGTQTTLPFGSAAEVRGEVLRMIEKVGKGGGLILAPSHLLEPEVPWENVLAFAGTVKEYNKKT